MLPKKDSKEQIGKHDIPLLEESKRAHFTEAAMSTKALLYVFFALIVIGLIWAHFAVLDEVATGQGKVVPSMQIQEIQNLEGGILAEIYVKEGQVVQKNQVLARMDSSQFLSDYQTARIKYYSLLASNARLLAEQSGANTVIFPEEVQKNAPALVAIEENLFVQHQQQLAATMDTARISYELSKKQYDITKPMVAEGLMSQLDLLRTQSEMNDQKGKIDQSLEDFQSKAHDLYNTQSAELDQVHDAMVALRDKLRRTTIRSPVHGIVNNITISTIGGVIKPGETMMTIVPLGDTLLIEAKVRPQDIAFIHAGQRAMVKFTAYDSSVYGGLQGKVLYISADTITQGPGEGDGSAPPGQSQTFYKILVKTGTNHLLDKRGKALPIIPGMVCTVDVLTGKRTVLSYLLKPIIKAQQSALRER
jgi:adhesin transport system membrane fusion protein